MRLDSYLAEINPDYSRSKLADLIKRGFVLVDGKSITKPGFEIQGTEKIELIKDEVFVSRAGDKLSHALDLFNINLIDKTVIDVGASTGGFTDLSLRRGASLVYAYDVGTDQLHESLKNDVRVKNLEKTNILDVVLPEHDICVIDVSFTSIFPILDHVLSQSKEVVFLLKPQFDTEGNGLKKGVLKDEKILKRVLGKTTKYINEKQFFLKGFTQSSVLGKDGNKEFLFYITRSN